MRRIYFLLFSVVLSLILVLSLTGCTSILTNQTEIIEGCVVDSYAGAPVVGAAVTAWKQGATDSIDQPITSKNPFVATTTDAAGYYRLAVSPGEYTLIVAKDGYATSKVEGVDANKELCEINIVELPRFNDNWPAVPPEVALTGITNGAAYSGPIQFCIAAHGANDISGIYVSLGEMPSQSSFMGDNQHYESTYTTGEVSIDPADFGVSGDTTFEAVVYDENGDRTRVIRHIIVKPTDGSYAELHTPSDLKVRAVTLSKHLSLLSAPLILPSGRGDIEITAAPPNSNLYVNITWRPSKDDKLAGGTRKVNYRVYRRFAWESKFTLIASVGRNNAVFDDKGKVYYWLRDVSPKLHPGVKTIYQVRACTGNTESAALEKSTIPLGRWDVRLLEPSDGAIGVSLTPKFSWYPTRVVGKDQVYRVRVCDSVQGWGDFISSGDPKNLENEFTCPWDKLLVFHDNQWVAKKGTSWERLQPYRSYEWYVDFAAAYDNYDSPTAVSIAVNDAVSYKYSNFDLPATEVFRFTTGKAGGAEK